MLSTCALATVGKNQLSVGAPKRPPVSENCQVKLSSLALLGGSTFATEYALWLFSRVNHISPKSEIFVSIMSKQSEKSGNKQVGSIAEVGLMADFGREKAVFNPKLIEGLQQKAVERIVALRKNEMEHEYENLAKIFKLRFAENPEIFEGINDAKIFAFFEAMSRLMLAPCPTRISADITFEASIILQGHYGGYHVYWEVFFSKDTVDEHLHSTLNIYADQSLFYTGGGNVEEMINEFVRIITPLFEKLTRVQIL